ncbi:MAG: hypothetical protein ABIL58_12860 [Pseudomonadota bacterium]
MKTKIYLTLDLFTHRWFEPDKPDAAVWLCVQPHVELHGPPNAQVDQRYRDLKTYIENCEKGGNFSYVFISKESDHDREFVPVNFPSDVDLRIKWIGTGPVSGENNNTRKDGMRILNAEGFERDNREILPYSLQQKENRDLSTWAIDDSDSPPFAGLYNDALKEALTNLEADKERDISDLADQLSLAFWGGTRRRIRAGKTVQPGDVEFLVLETGTPEDSLDQSADSSYRVTNLHSLNGLMFKVLSYDDATNQTNILNDLVIHLTYDDGGESLPPISSILNSDGEREAIQGLRDYFKTLPDVDPHLLSKVRKHECPEFARRVYIEEQMSGFAPMDIELVAHTNADKKRPWFRRRAERRADADVAARLSELSRVVVHQRSESLTIDWNRNLRFEVADIVEARFFRYRCGGRSKAGWIVCQLNPTPTDVTQFKRELEKDPGSFADNPILDEDGKEIGADEVRFLGCYDFAWEPAPVVLYLVKFKQKTNDQGNTAMRRVSVLLPRRDSNNNPITLLLEPAGTSEKPKNGVVVADPSGPRWELRDHQDLPEVEFELLRLVDPPIENERAWEELVVAAAFKKDSEFAFARSAGRYEGVIRVDYPLITGDVAEQEIGEDLLNFNTLNIYHRWEAFNAVFSGKENRREQCNRFSELFPFWSSDAVQGTNHSHAFHYRFSQPQQSPPDELTGEQIRHYFDALYTAAGKEARFLDFRIENTYGAEIDINPGADQDSEHQTPLDIRPQLPTQVTSPFSNTQIQDGNEDLVGHPPFFTVELTGESILRLKFDRAYLDPMLAKDKPSDIGQEDRSKAAWREAHVQAIRALCELAYAQELELHGRFLAFDYAKALGTDNAKTQLVRGLKEVEGFKGCGWPIQLNDPGVPDRDLKGLSRGLLDDWGTALDCLEITLPVGAHPDITTSCNVVEFSLRLRRRPGAIPDPDKDWAVVRLALRPSKIEPGGPQTEPANISEAFFAEHLKQLSESKGVIAPKDANGEKLLALLSEGDAEAAGAWIVPKGLARLDSRRIMASITPLGFVPIERNRRLTGQTFNLVKLCLRALQTMVSLTPGAWNPGEDGNILSDDKLVEAWKKLFRQFASHEFKDDLKVMVVSLRRVIKPVHLARSLGSDEQPDDEISATIEMLNDTGNEMSKNINKHLEALLVKDIALYANAKALLYTRFRDGDSPQRSLTGQFHHWRTRRSTTAFNLAIKGDGCIQDDSDLAFNEGLSELAGTIGYGFVEVLPDATYSNHFFLQDAQAYSLESLIDVVSSSVKLSTRSLGDIDLETRRVRVPHAKANELNPQVFLPSREPIFEPKVASSQLLTNIQDQKEKSDWSCAYRKDSKRMMNLSKLLSGSIEPEYTQDKPRVSVFAPNTPMRERNPPLDDFLATAVFQVWSDEEDSFSNDAFEFWVEEVDKQNSPVPKVASQSEQFPEDFLKALKALSDAPRIEEYSELKSILPFIAVITQLIVPSQGDRNKPLLFASPDSDPQPDLRLVVNSCEEAPIGESSTTFCLIVDGDGFALTGFFEAYLLKPDEDPNTSPQIGASPYYLLFCVERPIWRPTVIHLRHTRNRKNLHGPDFAPVFGFVSDSLTSTAPQQLPVTVALDKKYRMRAESRRLQWPALESWLIDNGFLSKSSDRVNFELTISLFVEQRTQVLRGYFDDAQRKQEITDNDSVTHLPLSVSTFKSEEQPTALIGLPEPFRDFSIDLQWFTECNRSIFRLSNIRIYVDE